MVYTSIPQNRIMVHDLETGETSTVLQNGFHARYVDTGHLVFAQGDSLFAAPFDPVTLEVGTQTRILGNVVTGHSLHAEYAVSQAGALAYFSGTSDFERTLVRVDRTGASQRLGTDAHPDQGLMRLSPDGSRLALTLLQSPGMGPRSNLSLQHVFVYDLVQGDFDRLTADPYEGFWPVWTPDGRGVSFSSLRAGQIDLYLRSTDKSRPTELLYANEYPKWPSSWSPDGEHLAFFQDHPDTGDDIWLYSQGEPQPEPFRTEPFNEGFPEFSPDGRWLAYQADELGQYEVFVTPYPGPGRNCRVSRSGGAEPRWSSDGNELFSLLS